MVNSKRLALVLVAFGLMACGDGVLADRGDVVYLTGWNAEVVQPRVVEDKTPVLDEKTGQEYGQLMEGVSQQAETFFRSRQVIEFMGAVEQAFLMSGRYFELVEILRQQFEAQGTGSVAAPALAWTYLQLGNEPKVEEIIRQLEAERPADPLTWVVVGAYHASRSSQSMDSARQARDAFEKVLELDPDFTGFMALEGEAMRQQLEMLRRQVPADRPPQIAEAEPADEQEDIAAAEAAREVADVATEVGAAVDERLEAKEAREEIGELAEEDEELQLAEEAEETREEGPDNRAQAALYVAQGQRALQSGGDRLQEAQNHFRRALQYDEDSVDAGIGLLRVAARSGAPEDMLADQIDLLASRDLSARQAYDLGLFCLRNLKDRDRATSLLQRVEDLDPQLSRRLGVESLLQQ